MSEVAPSSASGWADFPVTADPRPIVLLAGVVRVGDDGFIDSDAKIAWMSGAIESLVPLPAGVRERLDSGGRDRRRRPTALTITDIEHGEAPFLCDRGPRMLPAFLLSVTGMQQPCTVLDPDCPVWWPDPVEQAAQRVGAEALIGSDGITVQLPADGGVGTEFIGAEFVEHAHYVVGRAITRQRPTPRMVAAIGYHRMVTGRLSAPLGGRVLVDSDGQPFAVQPVDEQL